MTTRDTSARIQRTRDAIHAALKGMLLELGPSQISVSELTRRAGISRKTFYLHYETIEALYEDILQETAAKFDQAYAPLATPYDHREVNRAFFMQCAQLEPYEERLLCDPAYTDFAKRLLAASLEHNQERDEAARYDSKSADVQALISDYFITSSLEFYRQWVAMDKRIPLEELIELTGTIMTDGVSAL